MMADRWRGKWDGGALFMSHGTSRKMALGFGSLIIC